MWHHQYLFPHISAYTYAYALPFEGQLGNAWSSKTIWEGLFKGLASIGMKPAFSFSFITMQRVSRKTLLAREA